MRLCYLLLSPTFGMHQYTADLAHRQLASGNEVHLVTTRHLPQGRYSPEITIHTPVASSNRGLSGEGLRLWKIGRVVRVIDGLAPDLVHVTGPHLWNPLVLRSLAGAGYPAIHTLHDLHPHAGAIYGRLLYYWNRWVQRTASHLLVHGRCFRQELLAAGIPPSRVTFSPLTHLFLSFEWEQRLAQSPPEIRYGNWALFFARFEKYKGLEVLLEASSRLGRRSDVDLKVVAAGSGRFSEGIKDRELPPNVEVRDRLIGDEEAVELFSRCGLVVLPYIEASQSALISAAYYFKKPVIVTRTGALPEYVEEGRTGWVIPPQDPQALADAMLHALTKRDLLVEMGQMGKNWYNRQRKVENDAINKMYNWERSAEKR
jgi:glycosyltransferase involved in cell wall biosynthesis